jgi:hypothetical protein
MSARVLTRRWVRWFAVGTLLVVGALLFLFPGRRFAYAFTLATGIGTARLQQRIDALENKAIRRAIFSDDERSFLVDFYATLATGGKVAVIARQTGKLLDHYLAGSGSDFELEPEIFTNNQKVQRQARLLKEQAGRTPCREGKRLSSPTFYMPDTSQLDSVFGLYHGKLQLTEHAGPNGDCTFRFRAEVPWLWPSYPSLREKYGNPHAESFPLPNLKSLLLGRRHALFVDNGLGQYLEELGLAKRFLAYAEWTER